MALEEKLSPRELYHRVWARVYELFWFRERLANWSNWEHRFDDNLHTDADAVHFATIMLESLQERYTKLLMPEPEAEASDESLCCQAWLLPSNIGYIKINHFDSTQAAKQIFAAIEPIQDALAFIVDCRNNQGGFIGQANKALSIVMDEGPTYILKERKPDIGYFEAYCSIAPEQYCERVDCPGKESEYENWPRYPNLTGRKPLIVLVNGGTGSASEFFAAVLRDNGRAVLIGTKTAGKGIPQNIIAIGNGIRLQITDGVFLPPSEQWFGDCNQTYYDGIIPHEIVENTDTQMRAALDRHSHTFWCMRPLESMNS